MQVLEVVLLLLQVICDVTCWANGPDGGRTSTSAPASQSRATGQDPPIDTEALARFVSGSPGHETRGGASILDPSTKSHPLWDRELDG